MLNVQVYADGTTTMCTHERKASIREFYGIVHIFENLLDDSIFFACLLSLISCSLVLSCFWQLSYFPP
jgi:hypothetical protein